MDGWQTALIAIVGGAAGLGGAFAKAWFDRRSNKALGLPSDTEKRIIDLREELIAELEKEVTRRTVSEEDCLRLLGIEVAKREILEIKVENQEIKIGRLLRRLEDGGR